MQESIGEDCPLCGTKKSMKTAKRLSTRRIPRGYPPLDIDGLEGQFCDVCGDGFWTPKSEQTISRLLAEHMAKHDAERVVASELASVAEAAEALNVTRQAVHKMMNEGRLRYVQTPSLRLPIRAYLKRSARAPQKEAGKKSSR